MRRTARKRTISLDWPTDWSKVSLIRFRTTATRLWTPHTAMFVTVTSFSGRRISHGSRLAKEKLKSWKGTQFVGPRRRTQQLHTAPNIWKHLDKHNLLQNLAKQIPKEISFSWKIIRVFRTITIRTQRTLYVYTAIRWTLYIPSARNFHLPLRTPTSGFQMRSTCSQERNTLP